MLVAWDLAVQGPRADMHGDMPTVACFARPLMLAAYRSTKYKFMLLRVGALLRGARRLLEAAAVLAGTSGTGRWQQLHRQLAARRNRLVGQLAEAFQVSK